MVAAIEATPVVTADNEDLEVDFEVVGIALATDVVNFKDIAECVLCTEDVFEIVRVDILAARIDSVLIFESKIRLGVVVSAGASVVIGVENIVCNDGVGASIALDDDTTALTGAAVVVCKAGTVIKISVT